MKKIIELMNDEKIGSMIFCGSIVAVIMSVMIFSCIRDEAGMGMVRTQPPLELTECSTCSP